MTNAELIEKLRILQNKNSLSLYKREVCRDAAAALEAADKRIAVLEKSYSWKAYAALEESIEGYKTRIAELEAQLPKEGEWIDENRRKRSSKFVCSTCKRTCYDIQPTRDKVWTKRCRYNYCPNCGAKMKGENDEQIH